jgi:hypothetical protein
MTPAPYEWIELAAGEAVPVLDCAQGVEPVAAARVLHAPDRTVLALRAGTLVARCSCWWTLTASLEGRRIGAIGHYAAANASVGRALLDRACGILRAAGVSMAVGPLDGTTWRRYRFVVARGDEPPFFLEPDNPEDWPAHWTRSIELPDGRRLAYADLGDPSGRPLLMAHGTPSSRLDGVFLDRAADRRGWRLIVPDRPGHGSSDPQPAGSHPERITRTSGRRRERDISSAGVRVAHPR